jgi:hypothetical protein
MNLAQNSDYQIVSTNEAASIICRFTPDMISDIVSEAITNKYRSYSPSMPNIVGAIETNIRMAQTGLPDYTNELASQKNDIYIQIINMVCTAHGLSCTIPEGEDIYTIALSVYDFLIAQFNTYLVQFFVNYINREKNMIYETLELASKRKEASAYSKRLYKNGNSKLAIIHANLEFVLQNICSYDVDFETYTDLAYIPDRQKSKYIQTILTDNGDFFTRIIVPYYQANYATLTTTIKLSLQGLSTVELVDLV